jgi:hypothetical protein
MADWHVPAETDASADKEAVVWRKEHCEHP